jgi:RHS repeat-associated protein
MNLGSLMNMQYNYSATQNNGRITSSNDYVTVEDANVSYTYDALNRLTGASAGSKWGEAYSYDGFGNLTDKSVTQVPAPSLGVSYDANNHQVGMAYDANGNQLWDSGQHATAYGWNMENKLVTQTSQGWPGAETWYSYDAFGRRVMKDVNPNPNGYPGFTGGTWEFYFYGITGQKLVTRMCGYSTDGNQTPGCSPSNDQHNVYFGSKLIEANIGLVVTDRLGNVRANSTYGWKLMSYFPYGEERTVTTDGVDKFGTYFRDGPGQDYAQQRYYNNGTGRFWSVDPGGMATADPSTPTSLNRYAYVNGDPVNFFDRRGLIVQAPGAQDCIADPDYCEAWDWGCNLGGFDFFASGCVTGGGGGPVSVTPPPDPPPPDCNQILTDDISTYLVGYDGGASPLNTSANIQGLASAGMTYDVDPRFIVALAVAESQAGTKLTWGPYNAWNIRSRSPGYKGKGKKPPYTSWGQAIDAVNDLIAGSQYFGAGLTTTSTIYPTYQGPGYETGLGNLNTALGQMHGNQNILTDPCNPSNQRLPNQ